MCVLKIDDVKKLIRTREKNSHKGNYGKVLIVGSSKRYVGAGIICANACMRSGSGLVTLAVEQEIFSIASKKTLAEIMTLDAQNYKEDFDNLLKNSSAIAVGCGLGDRNYTLEKVKNIFHNSNCGVVLDADALNVLSKDMNILAERKNKNVIVMTPHEGEFARLSKLDIQYIKENKIKVCEDFAQKYENVIVILKGSDTVITDGINTKIVNVGVPQMATGGMGDCLCGMITSFLGQGYDAFDACVIATFTHSYIANILSKKMFSVLATDIINEIPYTLKNMIL